MKKHKILAFLLALLVSIGLWFYAVTVVNPNDKTKINGVKVRIVGTTDLASRNLILTGGEEQFVDVEVSGRRSDLKELNRSSLEAVADVSNIDRPGEYEVSWTLDTPSTVASGDISLVGSNQNKVAVKVSEYKERPAIPVELAYEGELAEGYIRDAATLSSETLSVGGPAEEVEKIVKAVATVNLNAAESSFTQELEYVFVDENDAPLTLSDYVKVSAPTVRVSVPVLRYKQVNLTVKLLAGGGATEKDVECTIEPSTIGVTGSDEALRDLDELVIKEIHLGELTTSQEWTIIPELPAGVTNRASETSVKVSLRFKGLTTKRFTIPCASIERLNDVPTLAFGEQSVVVQVRGRASAINALTEDDIRIKADMTNDYDPTTKTVTLQVELAAAGNSAGIIGGPYTVQVVETVPDGEE